MAAPINVTPVLVADLLADGDRMPVYVHVIDHPAARVLVDTGMTQLHPAVADMDPRLTPLSAQADFDLASIDLVVNTHLHFDHCGGNHLFAGRGRAETAGTAPSYSKAMRIAIAAEQRTGAAGAVAAALEPEPRR